MWWASIFIITCFASTDIADELLAKKWSLLLHRHSWRVLGPKLMSALFKLRTGWMTSRGIHQRTYSTHRDGVQTTYSKIQLACFLHFSNVLLARLLVSKFCCFRAWLEIISGRNLIYTPLLKHSSKLTAMIDSRRVSKWWHIVQICPNFRFSSSFLLSQILTAIFENCPLELFLQITRYGNLRSAYTR